MRLYLFTTTFFLILFAFSNAQKSPKRELRGAWISTHFSLDWPISSQTPAQQQTALLNILDQHKATGMNALYFQVRNQSDALYFSTIEPWSSTLTGVQGKDPGWDPLQFAIEECHKRGMELHAWLNPYRAVATASQLPGFVPGHVAKQHPEWLLNNGSTITLNPGLQAVRDYLLDVILDIATRYDVDGIHFDDYFYPPAPFNDDATYNSDARGFPATTAGRADWRRDNINLFIHELYDKLASIKPWVKFGVSPSGIYRSSSDPAIGSNTASGANQHYSAVYADTKKWLQEGWIDYLAPQVYWYIGQPGSDYKILVPWWNNQVTNARHIYIGQAIYKVNDAAQGVPWADRSQITQQMRMNRETTYPNVYGEIAFRTAFLRSNPLNVRDSVRLNIYKKPALVPAMSWKDDAPPQAPSSLTAVKQPGNSFTLYWTAPATVANELDRVRQFVIYRSESAAINVNDTADLLAITPAHTNTFNDTTGEADKTYYYMVTAVDRLYNESAPSNVTDYLPPTIACLEDQSVTLNASCLAILPDYSRMATVTDDVTLPENITLTQFPAAGTVINGTGETSVALIATDVSGKKSSCTFNVKARDVIAPVFTTTAFAFPFLLIPPDNKMRAVKLFYHVSDNCGYVRVVLTVTSNEDRGNNGRRNRPGSDYKILDNHNVMLRAANSGKGVGRIYTITITATDASGNMSTKKLSVLVPYVYNAISTSTSPSVVKKDQHPGNDLTVRAFTNPTRSLFTLVTKSRSNESLQVRITDNLNRNVEIRRSVSANATILIGGNYRPGIYFVEVIQGRNRVVLKLIKY
ncbi:MAG: family 10 glycosylhydrolase [Chitinophagaceae bacterium]